MAEQPMKMPDLSAISASVKVVRWLVAVGQPVKRGGELLEVETDKATMVVESTVTGTLRAILAEPGQEVPTGLAIATFQVEGTAPATEPGPPPDPGATAHLSDRAASPPQSRPLPAPGRGGGSFFARNRQASQPREGEDSPAGGDEV